MEQLNVQLTRLTRSLRRARTVELPEGNGAQSRAVGYNGASARRELTAPHVRPARASGGHTVVLFCGPGTVVSGTLGRDHLG